MYKYIYVYIYTHMHSHMHMHVCAHATPLLLHALVDEIALY